MKTWKVVVYGLLLLLFVAGLLTIPDISRIKGADGLWRKESADIVSLIVDANLRVASFSSAPEPNMALLNNALACYCEGSKGQNCVMEKSSFVIEKTISSAIQPEIIVEKLLYFQETFFQPAEFKAVTLEKWGVERSFHQYKLKEEGGFWKITSEKWGNSYPAEASVKAEREKSI